MSIKDPKRQDDEFDAFLRGKDELSVLLQDIPQPSPSDRLDAAILADAERAATRNRVPPPAAANDAILPTSERVRRPSFTPGWGIALGVVVGAGITFLLLALQSASRIPRPPEGHEQPPIKFRMYPSEEEYLQPRDPSAQIPMHEIKVPKPVLAPPEVGGSAPDEHGQTSPQSADKPGSRQK
jgi:hypothetical protein